MIKVRTIGGKVHEGELFAIDPVTKSLALKCEGSYAIINPALIEHIQGDLFACKPPQLSDLGISATGLNKRELKQLEIAEALINGINDKVSANIQSLYDKIAILYRCKWRGLSIVVMDEYLIEPPYTDIKLLPGCDGSGLERLRKILDGERKKLNL